MENLHISKEDLGKWLDTMRQEGRRIFAPVTQEGKTDFKILAPNDKVADGFVQTAQSAKRIVFPMAEILFSYKKSGHDVEAESVNVDRFPETVVWKVRPCDARAFKQVTEVFTRDYDDTIFHARRNRITIVTFSCSECDSACFCTSVGGSPGSTEGSDIQVTVLADGGALVEVLTEKGEELAGKYLEGAPKAEGINKADYLADVKALFSAEEVREKLQNAFDSPIWKEQSER